ncbi:MAG: hypothetical protein HOP19_23950 [Acidobacteria bacterium]|nr:hypothetical protein [Acidobacteriota bacterium]
MLKKFFVLLLCSLSFFGCASDEEPENNGATKPPAATPAPDPMVVFGDGFADQEGSGDASWRWIVGGAAVAKLKNTGKDMAIRLEADVPLDRIKSPTVTITLNGEQLDQFTVQGARIEKDYTVPAAKQGGGTHSEIRITTNKTFVPKAFDPKTADNRTLGLSLRKLTWVSK